jgi:aryl-alcohol dehydrogenase-like predicted oxidoreductase
MSRAEPARWALGTAQLGMPYGVANRSGRPDERESQRILAAAFASGVRCLDTAAAYGDAEDVIGRFLRATPGSETISICTKLPAVPRGLPAAALRTALGTHLDASRRRLGRDHIEIVLAHAWPDVEAYGGAYHDALEALRADGSVGAFGASVYRPDEAQAALERRGVAAVQFPFNALDTRFGAAGITALCRRRGCASFARSPLLQGALTLAADRLPRGLGHAASWIGDYHALATAHGLEPARAALAYAAQHSGADWIVAGAETVAQVETQRDALDLPLPPAFVAALAARTAQAPENVIDPRRWGAS